MSVRNDVGLMVRCDEGTCWSASTVTLAVTGDIGRNQNRLPVQEISLKACLLIANNPYTDYSSYLVTEAGPGW